MDSPSPSPYLPLPLFSTTCCIPWKYKAEGRSSIVLSFFKRCNTSCTFPIVLETLLQGTILRVRKKNSFDANNLTNRLRIDETELLKYFKETLGSKYVDFPLIFISNPNDDSLQLVHAVDIESAIFQLPDEFINRVYKHIIEMNGTLRPVNRTKETLYLSGIASIYFDHSLINVNTTLEQDDDDSFASLCVEIKPKSGIVPEESPCRFCTQKAVKPFYPVSEYCPMDLFSKNSVRIEKAIRALVDSPQNNLRVFLNGIPIYTQEHKFTASTIIGSEHLRECLRMALVNTLLSRNIDRNTCHISSITENDLITAITHALIYDPILERLLTIQYEGIKHGGITRANEMFQSLTNSQSLLLPLPTDIQAILRAATANDCSLMITFKVIQVQEEIRISHSISSYNSISVIDLDSKSLEKAPIWITDEKIAKEAYHTCGKELGIKCQVDV
jgi:hypothetical protein